MTKFQYQTGDPGSASSLFFPANDPEMWSLLEAFPVGKIRVLQFSGSSWKSGKDPGGCWEAAVAVLLTGWGYTREKSSKDEGNSFLEQLQG